MSHKVGDHVRVLRWELGRGFLVAEYVLEHFRVGNFEAREVAVYLPQGEMKGSGDRLALSKQNLTDLGTQFQRAEEQLRTLKQRFAAAPEPGGAQ
jgi:hypothetical protein